VPDTSGYYDETFAADMFGVNSRGKLKQQSDFAFEQIYQLICDGVHFPVWPGMIEHELGNQPSFSDRIEFLGRPRPKRVATKQLGSGAPVVQEDVRQCGIDSHPDLRKAARSVFVKPNEPR
jgi:hypothetical protein